MNAKGVSVIMFGVQNGALNSQESWEQARCAGVNGICSDMPSSLQVWLTESSLQQISADYRDPTTHMSSSYEQVQH